MRPSRSLRAHGQRLAQRQELRVSLDIGDQPEHFFRRMGDATGGFEFRHEDGLSDGFSKLRFPRRAQPGEIVAGMVR